MLIMRVFFCALFCVLKSVSADETLCAINSKKCLNTISDKFLSISIDPALIIGGVNASFTTVLLLAQHLSPAYIQIAGPSTNLVKFKKNDDSKDQLQDDNNLVLTPIMWESLHDWLSLAKFEPIFGLSDSDRVNEMWNPRQFLPLLELSDKLNISCYWQLGYDCSNMNSAQYKNDLIMLSHILNAFPDKKESWKIAGDMHKCPNFKLGDDLKGVVDSVILKGNDKKDDFPKYKIPTWMVTSKSDHSIDFASALSWAKQIGDAAKNGFEAIFKNLSVQELTKVTPVYWVSLLHKNLMGRKVLDIKVLENKNISVYAHCTKNQNSFAKRGALTVLFVNEEDRENTISLKIGSSNQENIEIRSYILTSHDEEPNDIFLNDQKLWTEDLEKEQILFTPKVHRSRVISFVSLTAPPKSVSFFVLPAARIPACINNEDETQQIVQEIHEDQTIDFSLEISPKMNTRSGYSVDELYQIIEDELKSNEKHKKLTPRRVDRSESSNEDEKSTTKDLKALKLRHFILEKARNWEKQRRDQDLQEFEPQIHNEMQKMNKKPPHLKQTKANHQQNERKSSAVVGLKNFELTAQEVRKILLDRIKAKAAEKNVQFTNEELNQLLNIATTKISNEIRPRRDINMNMLRLKAGGLSNDRHRLKPHTQLQSSEEFIDDSESSLEKQLEEMTSTETKRKFDFKPAPKLRKTPKMHFLKPKLHPKEENSEITLKDVIQNLLEDGFEIVPSPTVESHQSIFDGVEHVQQSFFNPNDLQIGEFYIIPKHHQFENKMEPSILNLKNYFTKARTVEEQHDGINFSLENDYTHFDSGETPRFKRELENSVSTSMEHLHYVIGKPYDPSKLKIDENKMNKQKKLLKKRLYLKKRMQKKANRIKRANNLKNELQKNSNEEVHKRHKKSADDDVNLFNSNAIDNFINEIPKQTKYIRPELDREQGDYKIIFPNKDKIEIIENHGDTDIKFVHHTTEKVNLTIPLKNMNGKKSNNSTKTKNRQHIQKIPHKRNPTVFDKIFISCADFMNNLREKIHSYVDYFK